MRLEACEKVMNSSIKSVDSFGRAKILSFYQDAKVLLRGKLVIPRMVSIWLSHSCNLNCQYCLYSQINGEKTFIDKTKFYGLLYELVSLGVESVEFSGGGEPTLHPDCYDFAEYAKRIGLRVGMLTNACKLDFDKVKHFDYIRIGLDAVDEDTYEKVKGGSKITFNRTLRDIRKLVNVARQAGIPRIGLKFMVNESNYNQWYKAIDLGKKLGVDYVHFRRFYGGKTDVGEEKSTLISKTLEDFKEIHGRFIYGDFVFENLKEPCFLAPIHSVITAKGDILNCCYFNSPEFVIGNAFEEGFETAWFSNRHKEIMREIKVCDCNKFSCRWRYYCNLMREIISGKGEISFI